MDAGVIKMVSNLLRKILVVFFIVSLSGCELVNLVRLKNANDDVVPSWQGNEKSKQIDLIFIGDKPYIKAKVNGKKELLFLIDTGASFPILFESDKTRSLDLKRGYEFSVGGWGDDERSKAYQTRLDSLSFAEIDYNHLTVAVIPIEKTGYFLTKEEIIFDGVIGHDMLRHFVWTFNRKKQTLTIQNTPHKANANDTILPFDTFFSKINVPVTVDFGNGKVFEKEVTIDTGSRHYFKLSSAFISEFESELTPKISAADFGLSGRAEHQRVTIPAISLGSNVYPNIKTNLIKSDDEDDHWVIGNALLSMGEFTIDYLNSKLYLAPTNKLKNTSRYNLLGLELRKLTTGNFIVRYAFPNLPSAKAGIIEGTIITKINGVHSANITENDWLNITNNAGEHELCSTLSEKQCWKVMAAPISGYSTLRHE